ncbi:tRNA(Ile)-lysidine synthetase [Enterococcus haemoperoxidus ATCC BAA-382]|uniref:tRNA(Ile)-lysidine synthase n=1 Tax=Enterococcus haemoperoxidus ATCC BAA-382 TaxID=1158608 RepID=R2SH03_9ENTE|nr:tRNA lysidine(34) synthetase TilS [Enterococcus haemoperoxidus]EOH94580.1 tRNA(Ile)-lysidine synthetase [Enterococcus haemoperoxidus ATCC BAA-382]EOT60625.1 tRNA(Ile)-lysidine synthetase [Enterococcus haemoperoxidus ATCC BAA-382]OJG52812.1 tRNA(Ile)-lysidine synthetase [Enterococcus haemoperoxidus]
MFQEFYDHCKRNEYWLPNQKILLAVSGGVDSMVLLELMQTVAQKDHLELAVAHIDHQLRVESKTEAAYLKSYCQKKEISYYSKVWEQLDKTKNTEARARKFRYDFFSELMAQEEIPTLLTAHHSDDQAETILMKLTRGSALANLVGIRERQSFGNGKLIRPFLIFPKERLEQFAKESEIVYFEDSSNQSDTYMRNRLRHQVVPVLKKENAKFLQHVADFSEQITLADEIIQLVIEPKYDKWVKKTTKGWLVQLSELKQEKRSVQTFFLMSLFQRTIVPEGVAVSRMQIEQLLLLLNQPAPQLSMDFEQGWQVMKEYNTFYLKKNELTQRENLFQLNGNDHVFLSEKEWLGMETAGKKIEPPESVKDWTEISLLITEQTPLPITVRHRQDGDRISLTPSLTKRLNRLFIDQKIPNLIRDQAWVILSAEDKIIWVPKFANSYLSIPKETDKILYRLLYKIKE